MNWKLITHLLYRRKAKPSGLLATPRDDRDFEYPFGGWFGYTPKFQSKLIPTVTTKDQNTFQTCQWNATTTAKEIDEQTPLSVRSIVNWGRMNGLCGFEGLSDLRSGQKALANWGILDQSDLPENTNTNWNAYYTTFLS